MANKINIQFFQDNALRTFAYFKTDSNYYGADHNIKFIALDKELFNNEVLHTGLIGEDSLLLTINATNDRPKWKQFLCKVCMKMTPCILIQELM